MNRSAAVLSVLRRRWAYALVGVPFLTDWIDTGHLPAYPREYVTELTLGLLVGTCVWLLYKDRDRMRSLAELDPLTGLPNKRRFSSELAAALSSARRSGISFTLGVADLDGFKAVNDRFGHLKGDDVLRQAARLLSGGLRGKEDVCYRIGGDEFALLLNDAAGPAAGEILQRVRSAVEDGLREYGVTVSVGKTQSRSDDDAEAIISRADQAMYARKRSRPSSPGRENLGLEVRRE